jgi:hypothetical protein
VIGVVRRGSRFSTAPVGDGAVVCGVVLWKTYIRTIQFDPRPVD